MQGWGQWVYGCLDGKIGLPKSAVLIVAGVVHFVDNGCY